MFTSIRRIAAELSLLLAPVAVMFLVAGCGGDAGPVTAESSKFKPAESGSTKPADDGSSSEATTADAGASSAPRKVNVKTPQGKATASKDDAANSIPDSPFPSTEGSSDAAVDENPASGRYPLPKGDTQTLLRFIDKLGTQEPQGTTRDEVLSDAVAIQEARLAAAKRALKGKLDARTRGALVQASIQIHELLAQMGVRDAKQRFAAFTEELAASDDAQLAEMGRLQGFRLRVMTLLADQPLDFAKLTTEVKELVNNEKESVGAFVLATQVCQALNEMAQEVAAVRPPLVELLTLLGDAYDKHADDQVAERAHAHRELARAWQVDVFGKCEAVAAGEADADDKLVAAVQELVSQPDRSAFSHAQAIAYKLEAELGKHELALQVYDSLAKGFEGHENKEIAQATATMAADARKRIGLIGQPLAVEGVLIDGKPFDPKMLEGKVVLVDFWATWCGPCLQEFPNIRRNYLDYREKGFEVVGVSLDRDMNDLEKFFSRMELPWTVIVSKELYDAKAIDTNKPDTHPLANTCGIDSIPFVVLIGKDGKVDSIHVGGKKLGKRLAELLGEPAAPTGKPAGKEADKEQADEKPAAKPAEKGKAGDAPKSDEGGGGCGADEPAAPAAPNAAAPAADDESKINPYSAKPGLSTADLVKYIDRMLDKPKTIQGRPGFAEALCEACDRVLAANPPASEPDQLMVTETKLDTLHKAACSGDAAADEKLTAFCEQMKADARPRIISQLAFFALERKVLAADKLPPEQIADVLKELQDYFATEKLTARHLRIASSTVALINRLENGEEREKHFVSFGTTFAKSSDKELARYGKKLAKKPAATESELVGKEMELAGATAAGATFDWKKYRGKIVLVDFWATWCGPCLREMPHVRELYDRLHDKGFEIVGVSVDKDLEALSTFLAENQVPWENLAGDETQSLAEKYGVRGIPTMMAVDKEGKILGVAHQVQALVPIIEKALEK